MSKGYLRASMLPVDHDNLEHDEDRIEGRDPLKARVENVEHLNEDGGGGGH